MKTWHWIVGIIILICLLWIYWWWNNRRKYETGYTIPVIQDAPKYQDRRSWSDWWYMWLTPIFIIIGFALLYWLTRKNR